MREVAELTDDGEERLGSAKLAELYTRHVGAAMRLSYLLTGNQQQAEDLMQEAFVRCVGRFRHLRVPDAFESYLRRTIVNLHTSGLRRKRLERAWLAREAGRLVKTAQAPEVAERADMWVQLQKLAPRQRAALVLRYYEDLSEHEAAEALGVSPAALKSLVARGTATLRGEMKDVER
jgi:RNA polymerase sigma-70 factor (sigma-E family)